MNGRSGVGAMGVSERLPDSCDGQLELLPMGDCGGLGWVGVTSPLQGFPGLMGGLAGPKSGPSGDAEKVPLRRCISRVKSAARAGGKLWWASSDEEEYDGLEVEWVRMWGVGS
jgi:hypothetical protein